MTYHRDLPDYLKFSPSKQARVNPEAVEKFAAYLRDLPDMDSGLNFYSFRDAAGQEIYAADMYPPLNHPEVINFFFYVCSQQFGFWYANSRGYVEPLFGTINGKQVKGADLLFKLAKRAFDEDQEFFQPQKLAELSPRQFAQFLSDDNGPIIFPDWEDRYCLTTGYGGAFQRRDWDLPAVIVDKINAQNDKYQVDSFCDWLFEMPGYRGDYLNKKSRLLAMALANRPEMFFVVNSEARWYPIIDYHLMRLALRLGLVEVKDSYARVLAAREWIGSGAEGEIRGEVFNAICQLIKDSGKSMAFIDFLMWSARKYCPEMTNPECEKCRLQSVCAKRTELFQPIYRTTAY